jgi:2-alkenal reductase
MYKKKSFVNVGMLVGISLLVLSGCGPLGSLLSQSAPPAEAKSFEAAQTVDNETLAAAAAVPDASALTQGSVLSDLENALAGIYEDVNPSVVSIQVTKRVSNSPSSTFEGGFQQGSGSGFVWDTDGHIITNNHVIEDADRVSVRFFDGAIVTAEVVGADRDSDLAVLKVDVAASQLHPVRLATDKARVGELAVAIGSPFALENTMTVGFVSALGRTLPVDAATLGGPTYTIPDIIQTDAPINPGNSGGVLVNELGEVIGVTSAIISPVQASVGIGFAIPAEIVAKVVPVLIEDGSYTHAWLGLSGMSLTPDIAEAMGLDVDQRGALVIEVLPDSPSESAGLRGSDGEVTVDGQMLPTGGDVIIALGGAPVQTFDDLVAELARYTAGQTVPVTVLRDGEAQEVSVILGARPVNTTTPTVEPPDEAAVTPAWLGIMATSVNPGIAKAMDLPENQKGVLVGDVQFGSPADNAGLRGSEEQVTINGQDMLVGGDIITGWNDETITGMQQLQALLLQSSPGDEITLTILRDGVQQELAVVLEARTEP